MRAYARQARESLEVQNDIAEIKLRVERRIGGFSRELPKSQGKYQQTSYAGEFDKTSLLSEAGISHPERYEAIASLPDEVFKSISKMSSRVTKNSQQQEY